MQLQANLPRFIELGVSLVAVSPDAPAALNETSKNQHLSFALYSDRGLAAARGFGIAFGPEGGRQLPVPAVFVINGDGSIDFEYVNPKYAERLDMEVMLAAAKAADR